MKRRSLPSRAGLGLLVLAMSAGAAVAFASACGGTHDGGAATPDAEAADAGADVGPPLETVPPSIIAKAKRKDSASSPVLFDVLRGGVWTANGDVGSISYVEVDAHRVVQEVAVGRDIRSVALSPDARWLAAVDREGATVTLLDAETRAIARVIPVGSHPRAAVWDSASPRYLYVAVEDDDAVVLIDRVTASILAKIPVGRVPSGLAVSRFRRELYVTHRIDAKVSIVDLGPRTIAAEVPIAPQDADRNPKTPQGAPFAFESLAWAPDGNTAWLPHELLANVQPFQFQSTLFPAISVVDLDGRAEVETDPSTGIIDGRKLLFDAIQVLTDTSDLAIVSQPCAAAFHPNGILAYVLACASEDLLVFDLTQGIATTMLRNLPGDHPVGLALDDTGQRAWVLSDQSHTLTMVDLAGGSPILEPRIVGAPLPLVAKDPVDPETREGLKLWFSANSAKGALATTGSDWMSCGGCHLDGLVSTNTFFFESLTPKYPDQEARIGHRDLQDLFSTAPTPGDPSFHPHDILAALLEQGGLAPDRSGARRTGAVDPNAPTADAQLMASRLARVIARDLPVGPSWLLDRTEHPVADYDAAWCGRCHETEYKAWNASVHAHAAEDPMVLYGVGVEQSARGPQYSRLCAGCHDPVSARLGDTAMTSKRGVTCLGCHDVTRLIRAGGNADIEASSHDWTVAHATRGAASLTTLRKPDFCGGCHQQFVPGTGLTAIATLTEHQGSAYAAAAAAGGKSCVDCHMPIVNGTADHRSPGGNVYFARTRGDADLEAAQTALLRRAISLQTTRSDGEVVVHVTNSGAGHAFPTGVSDIREPWLEVQALDTGGHVVARFGGPDAAGLIPAGAVRFGMDIAAADGTPLTNHQLSETTRVPFERRIAAKGTFVATIPIPTTLPDGTARLDAVLYYRNVRTPYFRAATGNPTAAAPDVEVARAEVE
jgi:YVTN family beta-propeller protein